MTSSTISNLPPFAGSVLPSNFVFGGEVLSTSPSERVSVSQINTTVSAFITTNFLQFLGYSTVGNGIQYNYQTVHSAQVAGKSKLWILTDITETVDTTFSSDLELKINNGVNINFNDGITWAWAAGAHKVNFSVEGTAFINYTHTSPCIVIDLSLSTGGSPIHFGGNFEWNNGSAASVDVVPLSTGSNGAIIERFVYNSVGINSYFDLGNAEIEQFVLVPSNSTDDCYGFKITGHGNVGSVVLTSDCTDTSVIFSVNDTTVSNLTTNNSNGVPTSYLINSTCDNAHGINQTIAFDLSATNSGERSYLLNARNIVAKPTGTYPSTFTNCNIAGTNTGIVASGTTDFQGCTFGGSLYISNTTAYFNFSNCKCQAGVEVAVSPGTILDACDFGVAGGSTGLVIDAGASNTTVIGGRTNIATVDNGTNTQIIPALQTF